MSAALDLLLARKEQFDQELDRIESKVHRLHRIAVVFVLCWTHRFVAYLACAWPDLHLRNAAAQVYEVEGSYLGAEHSQLGTVLKVTTSSQTIAPPGKRVALYLAINAYWHWAL